MAMGDTVRFAERMGLIEMTPRGDLTSTGYALVNPGVEYLVLQPEPSARFTVTLEPNIYAVEWFRVEGRETVDADAVTAGNDPTTFQAPFGDGPSILYLAAR
jgi:hypothetical protein